MELTGKPEAAAMAAAAAAEPAPEPPISRILCKVDQEGLAAAAEAAGSTYQE